MDDKPVVAVVVNPETGEITDDLHQGDRIVRANSTNSYKKTVKKNSKSDDDTQIWNLDNFYRANISELALWMDDLSQSEKVFLFSVSPYISFEDCRLTYDNGVDIGTEKLIQITGMSRSKVYETIDSLHKKDIIYRGKNSRSRQYFINPWLFSKGNRINKVLKGMFRNYRIRVLDGKCWKDLK